MNGYEVTVTAQAPLMIAPTGVVGNVVDTLQYVPGSVLRGALAALWIRQRGTTPDHASPDQIAEFRTLFDDIGITYGPLYTDVRSLEPLSALRCKYHPDWAYDTAVDTGPRPQTCPECDSPLEWGKGRVLSVPTEERTRTQLTREETAAKGSLYSRHALPAGTTLRGRITGTHAWLDTVAESRPTIWLGGRRSVGGKATLDLAKGPDRTPQPRDDGLVCLRLMSPAVLVDSVGRPCLRFDTPVLDELGTRIGSATVERQWVRSGVVGGWHAASRLPKPGDIAIAAGSTVLLSVASPVTSDKLVLLERSGVGLRRTEGYGTVRVNPAPWRPPVQEPSEAEAPSIVEAKKRADAVPPDLRPRLIPLLRDYAVLLESMSEAERADARSSYLDRPWVRDLPPSQREAVEETLKIEDLGTLNDTVTLMEVDR